ncbi:amidophosphoribosyltransferase [Candidatus Kinetoplastibacterium oncopeltii TCC290E]|uniref:Amidophosphoribosyltransferase n=1 Tax=Candidatus Kinetoplastidibacterium stringomonadis TCC290E TaxID=1208920 RepID=M1M8I3_9PROT|nr:amidophosphoribosyltransferase [Candidatus Kinetoplastibacterium oncopeltii]AGF48315.1 amidophosphoribosyltransferase [Candidatus Kinetoplastibacterium oncopeltii TCC290E]
MCGIVGVVGRSQVNQLLYDSLLLLQHRGQDAAGIATSDNRQFYLHKSHGLVRDVFRTHNMLSLPGNCGIGQVRYPTSGSNVNEQEAQPFYVNAPFGIMFAHNGNLTNWQELRESLFRVDLRHINTNSDSEVLLNVFANELQSAVHGVVLDENSIFQAISGVHRRVRGAYAVVSIISGYGLVAFRDVNGIRPLCIGRQETNKGTEWMVASESVALEGNGFTFVRDIDPGEAIFIDLDGNLFSKQCAENHKLSPCIFEYIYFSRPDSFMDRVPVYDARLKMGEYLAKKLTKYVNSGDIDVVIPIPDSSRPAAMQLAHSLNLDYREGLIKNRYVGRTFIMPGQAMRRKSVRQKLNTISMEFKNKNVLLVDDSIVRGTTSKEIVEMARSSGANKVYFASAAAQIKYQNVYGIDMPTQNELIAANRTDEEIAKFIGADALIYQDIEDMKKSITDINNSLTNFDASCFDGKYITGDIDSNYLANLSNSRVS